MRPLFSAAFLLLWLLPAAGQPAFTLAGYEVTLEGDPAPFRFTVETRVPEEGVEVATLHLRSDVPATPPPLALTWSLPSIDVAGQWSTRAYLNKTLDADWWPSRVRSMLARDAPVLCLFGGDDGNRLTFAVSDARNAVTLSAGVREENGRIVNRIGFFTERHPAGTAYDVEVRFDRRRLDYARALGDVAAWWEAHPGYTPAPVSDAARHPLYSTWYSFHQQVSSEALLPELRAGTAYGLSAVIIDDGWQTTDGNRGYAYTGDWEPERMTDLAAFVDQAHALGVKVLLWYAVPLVGERSETFARFRGQYLRYWDGQGAWELDPRYPEVRRRLIDTYKDALARWHLDGFKFDFMGRFVANDTTVFEAGDGRDYASVNAATDRLMTDVMAELRTLKPDILIEFRQPYIGPLMRKYGNMFRAGDSPNAAVANRVRVVDLRLLSGATAVHADMLMWHPDEPVADAALHLLNVLFSVPQISVRLNALPDDHRAMLHFYLDYWEQNRAILLDGAFEARHPLANYPVVRASDGRKQVIARYTDAVVRIDGTRGTRALDVVNATASTGVVLSVTRDLGAYAYVIHDARGEVVEAGTRTLAAGVHAFTVPKSGLLALTKDDG